MFLLLSVSGQLWAHGGVVSMGNQCKLLVGPYTINFSGYQPQKGRSEQFCDDLPVVGESIIVLDFVEEKLRDMTVNFRVIKVDAAPLGTEEDGKVNEAELAQTPSFEIPAKHYSNGTMIIKQNFTEKGHFVGYVIVEDDDEKFISRFPFSVGYPKNNILDIFSSPLYVVILFLALGLLILFVSKKRDESNKKKKTA
jgi:hypothetical protein